MTFVAVSGSPARPRVRTALLPIVVAAVAIAVLALLQPRGAAVGPPPPGVDREYFIAVDEVAWDYAPLGLNGLTGSSFDDVAGVFVAPARDRIGDTYLKALYREYTDASFSTLKPRPEEWAHLGTLGPLIRASVGDRIVVQFKNNARFPFSMHPHGVFYDKASEGAPYADGTSGDSKDDDAVPPGGSHEYIWEVPARAGPGPGDGSSVLWMYHSHVDENRSPYLEENIDRYAGTPASVHSDSDEFMESNLMHSINGYVYGNLTTLDAAVGERIRWYVLAMGTEVDLHTPHWHGQTLTFMGMRTDVIEVLPGSMKALDMVADNAGTWLFHCHVNDHIDAGMITTFDIAAP